MNTKKQFPPDPDGQNDDRAKWAQSAVDAFQKTTGTDDCDAVADLLCDLMHLADRNGSDFHHDFHRALSNYHAETMTELT